MINRRQLLLSLGASGALLASPGCDSQDKAKKKTSSVTGTAKEKQRPKIAPTNSDLIKAFIEEDFLRPLVDEVNASPVDKKIRLAIIAKNLNLSTNLIAERFTGDRQQFNAFKTLLGFSADVLRKLDIKSPEQDADVVIPLGYVFNTNMLDTLKTTSVSRLKSRLGNADLECLIKIPDATELSFDEIDPDNKLRDLLDAFDLKYPKAISFYELDSPSFLSLGNNFSGNTFINKYDVEAMSRDCGSNLRDMVVVNEFFHEALFNKLGQYKLFDSTSINVVVNGEQVFEKAPLQEFLSDVASASVQPLIALLRLGQKNTKDYQYSEQQMREVVNEIIEEKTGRSLSDNLPSDFKGLMRLLKQVYKKDDFHEEFKNDLYKLLVPRAKEAYKVLKA